MGTILVLESVSGHIKHKQANRAKVLKVCHCCRSNYYIKFRLSGHTFSRGGISGCDFTSPTLDLFTPQSGSPFTY